ncbi:MAG TPA: hypothetical protein VJ180_12725, partial [Pyrinomonadaceae bacterium]|nr:hypothetical protein [Pyrinomonadaceae bacterium]
TTWPGAVWSRISALVIECLVDQNEKPWFLFGEQYFGGIQDPRNNTNPVTRNYTKVVRVVSLDPFV